MIAIETIQREIILSQGFSIESVIRGIIGMTCLVLIAYLFSNNRKKNKLENCFFRVIHSANFGNFNN